MSNARPSVSRAVGEGLFLALAYGVSGALGLELASVGETVTFVWPPSGIALAALASRGLGLTWGVMLGAFAVNLSVGGSPVESLCIAAGNTGGAVVGAVVLRQLGFDASFARRRDVRALAAAACAAAMTAALSGAAVVMSSAEATGRTYLGVSAVWWTGDVVGIMAVAPALLAWSAPRRAREPFPLVPFLAVVASAVVVVFGPFRGHAWVYLTAVPCLLLVSVALRGGARWATAASLLVSTVALVATQLRLGPFADVDPRETGPLLGVFLALTAVMTSMLTALTAEARESEQKRAALSIQLAQAQRLESIGQLAGGVAHDFNNVLQAIRASLDMLERRDLGPSQRAAMLAAADGAVDRAASLVRQLLDFSRREAGETRVVDVRELARSTVALLARLLPTDVRLTTRFDARPCCVRGDAGQLDQLLLNLCVNARDAIEGVRGAGHVEVAVVADADLVRIEVTDDGGGIPAALRARVFEPFFTTKEPGKGTGLGLSVVYGVVQRHGGTIRIEDAPSGRGTRVVVELPRTAAAPESASMARPSSASTLDGRERILFADDDPHVRETVTELLEDAGYEVLVAADGKEAVELFEASAGGVDGVVLDVVMPRMGGRAALERIRARAPRMPALLCTGHDPQALGAETADVLVLRKPCRRDELLGSIRRALDVRALPTPPQDATPAS